MQIKRFSPIRFNAKRDKSVVRNDWEIILSYTGEKEQPALVDLTHIPKWEVQYGESESLPELGFLAPEEPSQAIIAQGLAVCRLTPNRLNIWDFTEGQTWPSGDLLTDISDGQCLLFLLGDRLSDIMQRLAHLDIDFQKKGRLAFRQGPLLGVPAKFLFLVPDGASPGMLIAAPRGYGQSLVDQILIAGAHFGLGPAGEGAFSKWWKGAGNNQGY
ncbi:MAG: hypothetical protein JRH15_05760 [Deltaproteobacteria bacterium]|nr:hypothetical protein [Deltaproteobacteria bacterium]